MHVFSKGFDMNYVNKAVLVAADESKSLEEMACIRMRAMANNGAGFYAFAGVVLPVISLQKAENRLRLRRQRLLEELSNPQENEY